MKILGYLIIAAAALFGVCLLSTIFGAAVGWCVGLFFSGTILDFLNRIGVNVDGLEMWRVGASLGFIGSFFRSTFTGSRNNG